MLDKDQDATAIAVDLPAVYSQGGFVQVRTIILQVQPADMREPTVANDTEPPADFRPAS